MHNITRVTSLFPNVDCSTFSTKNVKQNFIFWNRLVVKRNTENVVFQVRKSLTNYTSAPSTRHWKTTYLETIFYTVTWSFDNMFHQSLLHMIMHEVFELDCDTPMSTDISYRCWNLSCSSYCNLHSLWKQFCHWVPLCIKKPGATIWLQGPEYKSNWAEQNWLHMISVPDEDDQSYV